MPTFLTRNEINSEKWNEAAGQHLFSQLWYLDTMCDQWLGLVEGDYEQIMPVPVGQKWCIRYAYQPFFTQRFSILSKGIAVQNSADGFMKPIKKRFFKTQLSLQQPITEAQTLPNQLLALDKSYYELKAGYSASIRRKLKADQVPSITALNHMTSEIEEVITTFYLSRKLAAAKATTNYLQSIRQMLLQQKGELWCAYDSATLLNITIVRFLDSTRLGINSINTEQGRAKNASFYVIDHLIAHYAGTAHMLDFEGSAIASIQQRNHGFGATDEYYYHLSHRTL